MKGTCWILALLLLFSGAPSEAEAAAPSAALLEASSADGEIQGGEERRYLVDLEAGQTWRIEVDQQGIDLVTSLEREDGTLLVTVDSPLGRYGPDVLVTAPDASGRFVVTLRPASDKAVRGSYRLALAPLPGAAEIDRQKRRLEELLSRAGTLYAEGSAESKRQAVDVYRLAFDVSTEVGDRLGMAIAASAVGELTRISGDGRVTLDWLGDALGHWRAVGARHRIAIALNDIGLVHNTLGDAASAETFLKRASEHQAALGEAYGEAVARNNLCLLDLSRGDPSAAKPCFERVIELFSLAGERLAEALARNSLAGVYDQLGEPVQALEELARAYRLVVDLGDVHGQARLLANRAAMLRRLGEPGSALADYGTAIEILRQIDDRRWLARTLNNLGFTYIEMGDPQRARSWIEEALSLRLETGDRLGEGISRNNLGICHRLLDEPLMAEAAHRAALATFEALEDGERQATTYGYLGRVQLDRGNPRSALDSFRRGLDLLGNSHDPRRRGSLALQQAWAHLDSGDAESALQAADEAAAHFRALGDAGHEAQALVTSGRALLKLLRLGEALTHAERGVELTESLRQRIVGTTLRATFLDDRYDAYESMIEIQMALHRVNRDAGYARQALVTAERSRSRTLLDLLAAADGPPQLGPDAQTRRRELILRLRGQSERRQRLLADGDERGADEAGREIDAALTDLDVLEAEIARDHPSFLAGGAHVPLDLERLRHELDDAVLLEYSLGAASSYLWSVTADSVEVFDLGPRQQIETAARNAFVELRTITAGVIHEDAQVQNLASAILAPVAGRLQGHRLFVVPDGPLHFVPFAALPGASGEPLVARHEIVILPSAASLLAAPRHAAAHSSVPSVAVLADPVFDHDDPRMEGGEGGREALTLHRLPSTRREAEAIVEVAPPGTVRVTAGFEADLDAFRLASRGKYRILHLATHGVIDARDPELSGIVLSRFDRQGRPKNGFLGLHDLLQEPLDVDLVVLSGCDTADGRPLRGEGPVGLARGFLYAGAPRMVATLWRVEDKVTAEFMRVFYRELFQKYETPAAALRMAQLEIRGRRAWQDPFYWGAFVLVEAERQSRMTQGSGSPHPDPRPGGYG